MVVGCVGGSRHVERDSKLLNFQDVPSLFKIPKIPKIDRPRNIEISRIIKNVKKSKPPYVFGNYFIFNRIYPDFKISQHYSRYQRCYQDSTNIIKDSKGFYSNPPLKPIVLTHPKIEFQLRCPPTPPSNLSQFQNKSNSRTVR